MTVALGSIPELPAASCEEIKMSEGQVVASEKYWMICINQDMAVLAYCNMTTGGELNHYLRAFASQHTILYNSGKMAKFVGRKIRSMHNRLFFYYYYYPGYSLLCDETGQVKRARGRDREISSKCPGCKQIINEESVL